MMESPMRLSCQFTAESHWESVFIRATPASVSISCRRVSVCPSVCHKSGVLLKQLNIGSRKQRHTIAQRRRKYRQNVVTPNGGGKCTWGTLNASDVAENWRLSTRSVANLARSQVYNNERPPARCSALREFVSDS